MGFLIIAMIFAYWVRDGVRDTTAMITGNTPPSHAYRMAKMEREGSAGLKSSPLTVLRHWFEDACEDLDAWRADRRRTRPERRAARQQRKDERQKVIDAAQGRWHWGWREPDLPPLIPKNRRPDAPEQTGRPAVQPDSPAEPSGPAVQPDSPAEPSGPDRTAGPPVIPARPYAVPDPPPEQLPTLPAAKIIEGPWALPVLEGDPVTTDVQMTADIGGLFPHIRWTAAMAAANRQVITRMELLHAQMRAAKVGPQTLNLTSRIIERHLQIAERYERVNAILVTHIPVFEARMATGNEAGSKAHTTGE